MLTQTTPTDSNPLSPKIDETLLQREALASELEFLLDERKILQARTSFSKFCEYVIKDEVSGNKIKLHEIHHAWIKHTAFCHKHSLNSLILAPMGHGKTQIFSVALPLYWLGRDPRSRIILLCLSDDLAKQRLASIVSYIEEDEDIKKVFPGLMKSKKTWTKTQININKTNETGNTVHSKDYSIVAKGILSTGIGSRCDYLIVDDIFDYRTAIAQPSSRKQIIETFNIGWMSRLEPGNTATLIMTRWHQLDLPGIILESDELKQRYGILVQAINATYDAIEQTVHIPDHLEAEYRRTVLGQ